ncbi:MAG: TetR/AcrR family transcriptional regulator [Faecalicoccus sp.]|nr:TetR/AcrR family transcriptional regulator [Faecalicoccus sp.]
MPKKSTHNTKERIIDAAWKLFYDQGYEETTIEDIITLSQTSRGSFYHYFPSKDSLLGTLSYVFDEKYKELHKQLDEFSSAIDKLLFLNHELFLMIEDGISRDLLTGLLSTQLIATGEKSLLERDRYYFRLLRQIAQEGIRNGEFKKEFSSDQITKAFTLWERALMYDWCLCEGEYSLTEYSDKMTPLLLQAFK